MGQTQIKAEIQEILTKHPSPDSAMIDAKGEEKCFVVEAGEDVREAWEDLVGQMRQATAPAGFVLRFGKGEHVITDPLYVDGSELHKDVRLTIEGEDAVLTGCIRLDSARFVPVEGKPYYCCQLEPDEKGEFPDFRFLTVNGRMIRPAQRGTDRAAEGEPYLIRHKRTYDAATKAETNADGAPKMYLDAGLFDGVTEQDFETMELYLELHWYFDIVHITGIDRKDQIPEENLIAVYIQEEEYRAMRAPGSTDENYFPDHIYWVENCLTFLEKPDTYFYDRRRGLLYYYPGIDKAFPDLTIGYALPENLLIVKNMKNVTIRNLEFTCVDHKVVNHGGYYAGQAGNVFRGASYPYAAVYGENIDGLSVCGCTFRDMAGDGLSVRGRLRRVNIASNRFLNIGASAIRCGDFCVSRWSDEVSMKGLLIENNYLNKIGWYLRESVALMVSKVFHARIRHNTIKNCCYSAISAGTHYGPGSFQKDVSGGNLFDVIIAFNYITDFMTDMRDGAAIYTLGYNGDTADTEPFNFILGNVVVWSDISGDIHGKGHTSGWYNDNESTHWLDLGNVQFINPGRRWPRMYFHYVQTSAHNITIRRNAYVNFVPEKMVYGDINHPEDAGGRREDMIYWNIDADRSIYESETSYFKTAEDLTEEWRQIVSEAGCNLNKQE